MSGKYFRKKLAIFPTTKDNSASNNALVRPLSSARLGSSPEPDLPILSRFDPLAIVADAQILISKGLNMATGTVKWFNEQKGFGFIQPDEGGADVFVHISAVERSPLNGLREGQKVGYELERDNRSGKMSAGNLSAA
jgi:CspA family cold shock protein